MENVKIKQEEELELNAARERIQSVINRPRFDFNVVARYLCQLFNVSDPSQIVPFGNRVMAWEVMRPVTLGVEVGSIPHPIKKEGGEEELPAFFQFKMEPETTLNNKQHLVR